MIIIKRKKDSILPHQFRWLLLLLISLFVIGTIGYIFIKGVSVKQAFVLTLETLSFSSKEATSAIERAFQLFLLLFGTFILWFTLWGIFDFILEGKFNEYFGKVKMMKNIQKLRNHYIICGAGRVGLCVAKELRRRGKDVVIAERDPAIAEKLVERGYLVVHGTSTDEDTLIKAGIRHAKYLIASTGDDGKNILIILTAKELNSGIKIGARATTESIIPKLKHAGADYIVLPEVIGGIQLVEEMLD
ncbi:MAG: NAD(P)-binding protein [Nanoarchaeota archaeon]